MTVNIKGKEYKTVAERLNELCNKTDGMYSLTSEVLQFSSDYVVIRATLKIYTESSDYKDYKEYTGISYESKGSNYINETSHVENAETSAWGRALAAAGYIGSEIASADEVATAIKKQECISKWIVCPCGRSNSKGYPSSYDSSKGYDKCWLCVKDEKDNLPGPDMGDAASAGL